MTYDKICLMLPTYKRPKQILAFVNSAMKYADDWLRLRFCFCVNKTDEISKDTIGAMFWPDQSIYEAIEETTVQPNLSLYFNMMYNNTSFNEPGTVVSMVGDDMVFLTKGWDTKILEKINEHDGLALVYCDDNFIAHEKMCVNLFTTRKLVETTGKPFMCEFFHADMIDLVWQYIGTMTGLLKYMPEVIIQHNHSTKVAEKDWDETFKRLSPVQKVANNSQNQRLAVAYSTLVARRLIDAGVGKWNIL